MKSIQSYTVPIKYEPLTNPAFTRSGISFNPNEDRWQLVDAVNNVTLRFDDLPAGLELVHQIKRAILWSVENLSPSTASVYLQGLRHFLGTLVRSSHDSLCHIGVNEVLSYRSTLSQRTMWRLGTLSAILRKWHALGVPGVSDDAVSLLKELRIPGNTKGTAVRTMDPINGPLTDIEYENLLAGLHDHFAQGKITLHDYVLSLLVISLGQRPVQYAALKAKDLVVDTDATGSRVYMLRVPRAKQRYKLLRETFQDRVLNPTLGHLVLEHTTEVYAKFKDVIASIDEAPMFPDLGEQSRPPGFEYHFTARKITQRIKRIVRKLKIRSMRTGKPMNMSTYRLRRTVGTRAAAEGHGELVIAELLDHSDTQQVGVYVEAVPRMIKRIDRALAFHLAPMAQAFMGELRQWKDSDCERERLNEVWSPQFSPPDRSMGNCSERSACNALAPIACYTCRRFQPWLDGPHEEVLQHLLTEREKLMDTDPRIASILDRTILAVSEVVMECAAKRKVLA